MPIGTIVENNTFYRCYHYPIKFAFADDVTHNTIIRNNTFQLDVANGITPAGSAVFYLYGDGRKSTVTPSARRPTSESGSSGTANDNASTATP